ncbi:hypothetical protein GTW69_44075 [Streptomyces sp. SID7760]|nr:hypothetical protein [Streptomyces sp. SID7760]
MTIAATAAGTDGCGCSAERALTRPGTEELAARLRAEPSLMISSINFGVRSLRGTERLRRPLIARPACRRTG